MTSGDCRAVSTHDTDINYLVTRAHPSCRPARLTVINISLPVRLR